MPDERSTARRIEAKRSSIPDDSTRPATNDRCDGTKILFTRYDTNFQGAINVMDIGGSNLRRLSPIMANDVGPSWQRTH